MFLVLVLVLVVAAAVVAGVGAGVGAGVVVVVVCCLFVVLQPLKTRRRRTRLWLFCCATVVASGLFGVTWLPGEERETTKKERREHGRERPISGKPSENLRI